MSAIYKYAIIVAGGAGLRMNTDLPKQFLLLKGKPILMLTIVKFWEFGCNQIVLVLPKAHVVFWQDLCKKHDFTIPHTVVVGGKERFNSVKNGLAALKDKQGLVAVHDGVRPCLTVNLINNCFNFAAEQGNAVAAVSLKDSIRKINGKQNEVVDRTQFKLIQTPQVFNLSELTKAYNATTHQLFTDDAAVFEAAGNQINLVDGEYQNIKITTAEDLKMAETFI